MRRIFVYVAVFAACLLPGYVLVGNAASNDQGLAPVTERILGEYPGLRVETDGDRVLAIYGKPMTDGATPEEAVSAWLRNYRGAFGVANLDLNLVRSHDVGHGKFTVFAYEQRMAGLPVENGRAKLLVLNSTNEVVLASGVLTQNPREEFPPVTVTPEIALNSVRATDSFGALDHFSEPTLVVFDTEAEFSLEEPVRAWKISGHNEDMNNHEAYTLFIDASNGDIVFVRDDKHHVDVNGNSSGNATPGTLPDTGSNPPVATAMPHQDVNIVGGNSAETDLSGNFTISNGGSSPVTVTGNLEGPWVSVFTDQGSRTITSVNVTPPGPANLLYNSSPSEFHTAQVNTFIHTNNIHDFFKDRQPGFTAIDISITANTNLTSSCNAFYSSSNQSINFYNEAGGCVNTAYTSVIAHEYGHFVVNRLGLSQGAFGEGFGDCCSSLLYDDPILGRGFTGPGTNVRDPLGANIQYPCGGAIHTCGQVLGATWYRIRQNFGTTYGSTPGLTATQQLFTDWAMITNGGIGGDSAHPTTAIEVLTVDDNDGNLDNGTPNYGDICDAFDQASIDCPEIAPILFTYPSGLPTNLAPNVATLIDVEVLPGGGESPVAGTGTMSYRINGGSFTTVAMNETSANVYEATLPAGSCFDAFDFYFTVDSSAGGTVSDPQNAPADSYSSTVITGTVQSFADDFQADQGWTVVNESLSDGPWERGVPAGDGSRGDPLTDADGSGACYLTDNVAGNSDVDDGPTRLISPDIDMSAGDGTISYSYWMYNDDNDDSLVVEVSNNSGSSWTTVTSYTGGLGGWENDSFTVGDYVTPNSTVRVRFSISDSPNDSVTEGGIDAISVDIFECDALTDCNDNGIADDIDIANGTSLDCNNNAIPDECDIDNGTSLDCNVNGVPDECDIASGFSLDCNGNGIPDECDLSSGNSLDCNSNNVPDECDIAGGFSDDCNGNGIPDECDLSSGNSLDCNSNNVPDECDIANGDEEDCNSNGIPDSCDLAGGGSTDSNGNGIPDECDGTITFCGVGATNGGCGAVENNLTINGSDGGPSRTIQATLSTPLSFVVDEPSAESGDGSNERICMYIWFDAPTPSDDIVLPKNLGNMCFGPKLITTRPANITYNSIGATNKLGVDTAPGPAERIPDGGTLEFVSYPSGFGAAITMTCQGIVQDVCTIGDKAFSITNGIVVEVAP